MTLNEMKQLQKEYGDDLNINKSTIKLDEDYGNKYEISYKGIIVGSELVDIEFVRNYIKEHVK